MLENVLVSPGDRLECGHVLGFMGSTGASTGPHLHFEVIENRISVDPEKFAQFYDTCEHTNIIPPEPIEPKTDPLVITIPEQSFTASVAQLRIREGPGIQFDQVGWIYDGEEIEITSISGMDLWGKHKRGWSALSHPDCDGGCVE